MSYALDITLTNETDGHRFSEFVEDLDEFYAPVLKDDGTPDFGVIFREMQSEYGRCQSSIYVDTPDGVKRVGWFFVSRQQYTDTREPYLRGAWVTVVDRIITPEVRNFVEVGS